MPPFRKWLAMHSLFSQSVWLKGLDLVFWSPGLSERSLRRNLPEITSDFAELGVSLNNLYERLPFRLIVSPRLTELKETIQSALEEVLSQLPAGFTRRRNRIGL